MSGAVAPQKLESGGGGGGGVNRYWREGEREIERGSVRLAV